MLPYQVKMSTKVVRSHRWWSFLREFRFNSLHQGILGLTWPMTPQIWQEKCRSSQVRFWITRAWNKHIIAILNVYMIVKTRACAIDCADGERYLSTVLRHTESEADNILHAILLDSNDYNLKFRLVFSLTAHNWQKWKKKYSWHVPAIKFIGMKQLV